MEINDETLIMQRPLTGNKQRKTKTPARKQHSGKISITASPHSRREWSESKFCASCSYREIHRSTQVCNGSQPWTYFLQPVPHSRIKNQFHSYANVRYKGPTIYEM